MPLYRIRLRRSDTPTPAVVEVEADTSKAAVDEALALWAAATVDEAILRVLAQLRVDCERAPARALELITAQIRRFTP